MRSKNQQQCLRVHSEVSPFIVWLPKRHFTGIAKKLPIVCLADPLSCARAPYVGLEGPVPICPQGPFLVFLVPVARQAPWGSLMGVIVHALILFIPPPVVVCTASHALFISLTTNMEK